MDQPKQPTGNFTLNLNFRRNTNKDAPAISGRISTPEDPERLFEFSAFEKAGKDGQSYWIGPVQMSRSVRQALNTTEQPRSNFVAIRENGFKVFKETIDGKLNPAYAKLSPDQQQHEDSKPAFWGTWTRAETDPQLKFAAWEREPNRYGPWASGSTQYPMSKEEAAALKAGRADAAELNAPEPAKAPRRAKAEAGARDRA